MSCSCNNHPPLLHFIFLFLYCSCTDWRPSDSIYMNTRVSSYRSDWRADEEDVLNSGSWIITTTVVDLVTTGHRKLFRPFVVDSSVGVEDCKVMLSWFMTRIYQLDSSSASTRTTFASSLEETRATQYLNLDCVQTGTGPKQRRPSSGLWWVGMSVIPRWHG